MIRIVIQNSSESFVCPHFSVVSNLWLFSKYLWIRHHFSFGTNDYFEKYVENERLICEVDARNHEQSPSNRVNSETNMKAVISINLIHINTSKNISVWNFWKSKGESHSIFRSRVCHLRLICSMIIEMIQIDFNVERYCLKWIDI
jgi:hypothetical protein